VYLVRVTLRLGNDNDHLQLQKLQQPAGADTKISQALATKGKLPGALFLYGRQ